MFVNCKIDDAEVLRRIILFSVLDFKCLWRTWKSNSETSICNQYIIFSRFSGLTSKGYFILFLRPVQDRKSLGWDAECTTDVWCFLSKLQVGHQLHYGGDWRTRGLWARYGGLELVGQGHANWLTNVSLFSTDLVNWRLCTCIRTQQHITNQMNQSNNHKVRGRLLQLCLELFMKILWQ